MDLSEELNEMCRSVLRDHLKQAADAKAARDAQVLGRALRENCTPAPLVVNDHVELQSDYSI